MASRVWQTSSGIATDDELYLCAPVGVLGAVSSLLVCGLTKVVAVTFHLVSAAEVMIPSWNGLL